MGIEEAWSSVNHLVQEGKARLLFENDDRACFECINHKAWRFLHRYAKATGCVVGGRSKSGNVIIWKKWKAKR